MNFNFYFSFIFLFFLLLKVKGEEEKIVEKEKEKEKEEIPKRKPRIKYINLYEEEEGPRRKSQTIELNSLNFDSIIQNGVKNRWLIIFYSESNPLSIKVKSKIDKIIEEKKYKSINNIKFASVDINLNFKLQTRFSITVVPVVLLVENDKMLHIANFPDEETLINNIQIENIEISQGVENFIHELTILDFISKIVSNNFAKITKLINRNLKDKKINYEISVFQFSLFIVIFSCIISYILFYGFTKCFCDEKKIIKKVDNKDSEEKIEENKEEENNNIKNNSEEEKKIIEEKKEEEVKEKLIKENENTDKKGEIKNKAKKKKKE